MDFLVISGQVASIPTLRFYEKDVPLTQFTLTIERSQPVDSGITIVCADKMAMTAAKYLKSGDSVTIEGPIDYGKILCDDGRWVQKIFLRAWEIRKCQLVLNSIGVRKYLPSLNLHVWQNE